MTAPLEFERPSIVLTGASGFIGQHLVAELLRGGEHVTVVARRGTNRSAWSAPGVSVVRDEGDVGCLRARLAPLRPTTVVHLATHFVAHHEPGDVTALIESNVAFGARVAEAGLRAGVTRFINASTSWQHLRGAAYAPVSLYAATKQAFEDILRHYNDNEGMSTCTLTLFDTYGPADPRRKLLALLIDALDAAEPLAMSSGNQFVDLTHVSDVVAAFRHAATGAVPAGVYSVSSGAPLRVRELVDLVGRIAGHPPNVRLGARPDRPNEMTQPWQVGVPLPGWQARIPLRAGIEHLLTDRGRSWSRSG